MSIGRSTGIWVGEDERSRSGKKTQKECRVLACWRFPYGVVCRNIWRVATGGIESGPERIQCASTVKQVREGRWRNCG